jgi:imidazole glycerol-phosphate synthase subunit HisH
MIYIIDYGIGNVQAFLNLYHRLGIDAYRASKSSDLVDASHLILPGVGHFDHAMSQLNSSGLRDKLDCLVLQDKIPLLGVCVGMQILANGSDEGALPGLGYLPGYVHAFRDRHKEFSLPIPHMGWNDLRLRCENEALPFQNEDNPEFYFLHSYYFESQYPDMVLATSNYGLDFAAIIQKENVFGMQCHPEKSHGWGEKFLQFFAEI